MARRLLIPPCSRRALPGKEETVMKAQVLNRYDDDLKTDQWVSLEEVADPKINKSTDVIVRIGGAGVCRTDLHIIEGVWRPHMASSSWTASTLTTRR